MMSPFGWVPLVFAALVALESCSVSAHKRPKQVDGRFSYATAQKDWPQTRIPCGEVEYLTDMMVELLFKWPDVNGEANPEYNSGVVGVIINESQFITTSDYITRLDKTHGTDWILIARSHGTRNHRVDQSLPPQQINMGRGNLMYFVFTVLDPFTPWSTEVPGVNRICYNEHFATHFPKSRHPEPALLVTSERERRPVDVIRCPCIFPDPKYICVLKSVFTEDLRQHEGAMLVARKPNGRAHLLALFTPSWADGCRHDVVRFGRIFELESDYTGMRRVEVSSSEGKEDKRVGRHLATGATSVEE